MNVAKELAALERMTVRDLRVRFAEVFGEETRAGNKAWLVKRIAWRIQSNAEGDLSERARQRAAELARDADVRLTAPKAKPVHAESRSVTVGVISKAEHRLPLPGTVITREYKGRKLQVTVLPKGFEYEGEVFKSLSSVAKTITGQHCNGFHFFRMNKEETL